jgi:hypothetical protein
MAKLFAGRTVNTAAMRRALVLATLLSTLLLFPSAAGASAPRWHQYRVTIPGVSRLATVRCPSNSMCVAITHAGQVLTTTNASAVHPRWKLTAGLRVFGPEEDFEQQTAYNLACPSTHLCVTSYRGEIISTTHPVGPASDWHAVDIQPAGLDAEPRIDSVTCPTTSLCVAGMNEWSNMEGGGTSLELATSTNPTGDASAWNVFPGPANEDYMTQLACSPGGLCAGGDDAAGVIGSSDPTAGTSAWSRVASPAEPVDYLACPSRTLCLGADFHGRQVSSTAPATSQWHETALPKGRYLTTVSCAGPGFCGATGADKHHATGVLTTKHAGNARRWSLHTFSARGSRLNAISCRSSSFCVAVGDGGLVTVLRRGR